LGKGGGGGKRRRKRGTRNSNLTEALMNPRTGGKGKEKGEEPPHQKTKNKCSSNRGVRWAEGEGARKQMKKKGVGALWMKQSSLHARGVLLEKMDEGLKKKKEKEGDKKKQLHKSGVPG